MNRIIRFAGLVLASLTISTVAMAQQDGGRGGSASGNGDGDGGDHSVIELRLQDAQRARLSRAVEPRRPGANCLTHACNEPLPRQPPNLRRIAVHADNCGGEILAIRNDAGRIVRYVCEYR